MANICGNYLQAVTKDMLENHVGLGICMARFASHCGIIGAHPKQTLFQLPLQLGAKCLVSSHLTISILGILRRHYIPLATHPHTTTGVNSRSSNNRRQAGTGVNSSSSNNSRSNSNNSKVGGPELAQPNTNLRLTRWTHARYNEEPYIRGTQCEVCHHKKSMCQWGPQLWVQGTSKPPPNVLVGSLGWRPTLND